MPFVTTGSKLIGIVREQQFGTFEVTHELEFVGRVRPVFDAVVQTSNITVSIFLHPQSILRDDDGVA